MCSSMTGGLARHHQTPLGFHVFRWLEVAWEEGKAILCSQRCAQMLAPVCPCLFSRPLS